LCLSKPEGHIHGADTAAASCQRGIGRYAAYALHVHGRKRAAGVETVPSEPEDKTAHGRYREVVRSRHAAAVSFKDTADARPKHQGPRQRNDAADRMYYRGTRKIAETLAQTREEVILGAHERQPAVGAPRPVTDNGVDKAGDADAIQDI